MNTSSLEQPGGHCPIARGFDPFDSLFLANPYPIWAELRQEAPVLYAPEIDHYLVTRYADITKIYKDQENYSASNASSPIWPLAEEAARILKEGFPRKPTLNNSDPPRHGPMRRAVGSCMGTVRWQKLEPEVRTCAERLLTHLVSQSVADIVEDLAFPLPAFAGFRLLGFPAKDTELLKSWCGERMLLTYGRLDAREQAAAARNLVLFWRYVAEFVSFRSENPDDDLTSDLLAYSRKSPELLNVEDINNIVYSISLAGHETTTNAIANGLLALLRNREQWVSVCEDPKRINNAVEELLRFESPVIGKRRKVKREVKIGDVVIPAGANILLLIGSANRDPARFGDPNELDVSRANAGEHVSFGGPWHYCLGAPLARFEMRTVLQLLTKMAPDIALASGEPPSFLPTVAQRGPRRILVEPRVAVLAR
jgi:cytochrome P450